MPNAQQVTGKFKRDHLSVKMFGAVSDGKILTDGAMTASSAVLNSPSAPFTSTNAQAGMIIAVVGAGAAGATLLTTIASYTDSSHITLAASASSNVSGAQVMFGTNNYTAFSNALTAATGYLLVPAGVYCLSDGITIPTGVRLEGKGRKVTTICYLKASGDAVTISNGNDVAIEHLEVRCPEGPNTARGVYVYNVNRLRLDAKVWGFDVCEHLSGNDTTSYSNDLWLYAPDLRMFRTAGLKVDHAVGLHLIHGLIRTADWNPLAAMGIIFDTACSGIYVDQCDLEFCGMKIQNSMPTVNDMGKPPEWFYLHKVAADSCPTHAIHLDASLGVADGVGRVGKSFHFMDCWAAYATTDNTDGLLIEGGLSILWEGGRVRVNRRHGIHVTGGDLIRLINVYSAGNNFQNVANGSGIYIEGANTGYVNISGGVIGDYIGGDGSGHQQYGVYLANTFTSPFAIINIDFVGNHTAPIGNFAVSSYQRVLANVDAADIPAVANINRLYMNKGRLEVGDGSLYLDFMNDLANSVNLTLDSNVTIRTTRGSSILELLVGAAGAGTVQITASLLAQKLQTQNIVGANIAPEVGWDFKTVLAKITAGLRLAFLTPSANTPVKVSTLGDVLAAAIDLAAAAEVTGTLQVGNGGTGRATLSGNGVVIGAGAGAVNVTGAGTSGQVLTSNGSGIDPTFQDPSGVSGLNYKEAEASASLTLTASWQDVTGASVTADKTGIWEVTGSFDFLEGTGGDFLKGCINVNGVDIANPMAQTSGGSGQYVIQQTWFVSVSNGQVIKLRGMKAGTTGTDYIIGVQHTTWIHAKWIHS